MKPTIIHIVQHLKPGGIENFALEFQRAASQFYDVHVVSLERCSFQQIKGKYHEHAHNIHVLDKKPGWQPKLVSKLTTLFNQLDPLYVHTHHIGPLVYGGTAAKLAGVECIIHTEHDAWHLNKQKRRLLQEMCLKMIKPVFVADANFVAEQVKRLMPAVEPFVIPNGIDAEKFAPAGENKAELLAAAGLPTNLRYIGCAARLEPVKAHHVLIQAVQTLPEDIGLLLAGDGSVKGKLQTLVKKLGLSQRVFFLGHVDDMQSFYQLLDVFCLSSNNEGLPLAPLEAQACNVPVVLTDVGGCREAVCQQSGQLVEPNNPKKLSAALWRLLSEKIDIAPRDFVERERSIKNMISRYVALTQPSLREKL